jgi:hypothetical protein
MELAGLRKAGNISFVFSYLVSPILKSAWVYTGIKRYKNAPLIGSNNRRAAQRVHKDNYKKVYLHKNWFV